MPENPLEVDPLLVTQHQMLHLDSDGDGKPDGFRKLLVWTLNDLPYPNSSETVDTYDPLGPREREAIDRLGTIGERNEVVIHRIRGHASAEGSQSDNEKLSQRRAEAVADSIAAIPIDHPTRNVRISATAIVEGLGEGDPIVFTGEDDHPLNRRVEIELEVGKIVPDPVILDDPPSRKWRISYSSIFSFYRMGGAQIGFGTIERLHDNTGEPFVPPHKKDFWYWAAGVGIELGGKVASGAKLARNKSPADRDAADKANLFLDDLKKGLQRRLDRIFPEDMTQDLKNVWDRVTETFEALGPDEFAAQTIEQKTATILGAIGLSSLKSKTLMDGYFETDEPVRMSEMDLSVQVLLSVNVSGKAGIGGSFAFTGVLMWIYRIATEDTFEFINTVIAELGIDVGFIPGLGVSVSGNLSSLHFK